MINQKTRHRIRRKRRIRGKISGTQQRPRLSVYRSNRNFYAQLIDDQAGVTISSVASGKGKGSGLKKNIDDATKLGELWAQDIKSKGVKQLVFDCNGFRYHGVIASFADGLRRGGLLF